MIDERSFIQNQYNKIKELDSNISPINYFFYSNGIHFLCIKKLRTGFGVCGLNTGFHVLFRQANFDVYYTSDVLIDCVKTFERFINLLLIPAKFEFNYEGYQRDLL